MEDDDDDDDTGGWTEQGDTEECPICSQLFPTSQKLKEHIDRVHKTCQICNAKFTNVNARDAHVRQQHR